MVTAPRTRAARAFAKVAPFALLLNALAALAKVNIPFVSRPFRVARDGATSSAHGRARSSRAIAKGFIRDFSRFFAFDRAFARAQSPLRRRALASSRNKPSLSSPRSIASRAFASRVARLRFRRAPPKDPRRALSAAPFVAPARRRRASSVSRRSRRPKSASGRRRRRAPRSRARRRRPVLAPRAVVRAFVRFVALAVLSTIGRAHAKVIALIVA